MTTRDGLRKGRAAQRDADRIAAAEAGPSLPERLVAARERKGVDLYRAERDTKIRARYLAALEHGEYAELPGAVYTKGFLRNYALYLGLDPDDVLLQWRRERGEINAQRLGHSLFAGKARRQSFAHSGLALEAGSPRVDAARGIKRGVLRKMGHDRVQIVAIESVEDSFQRGNINRR